MVSRGELVEIGGGFRVPEVMAESGARLVEVGTTNRTHLDDYRSAISRHDPALVLKVHQSNYRIVGFTEAVDVAALAALGVSLVVDLGSGLLDSATPWLAAGPPAGGAARKFRSNRSARHPARPPRRKWADRKPTAGGRGC